MVAEMLRKYIFMFNIFLSKKLCIFIFNQKIIFVLYGSVILTKYIYIQSKHTYIHLYIPIYTYICILIFSLFIFRIKNRSLFNRKKNVSNEIFLFNDFWESNLVFHLFVK